MTNLKKIFLTTALFVAPATHCVLTAATPNQNSTAKPDIIVINPLFEYPVAPEDLPDLADKSNYLMEHFWDNMDFKTKSAVDQIALNDAFNVYVAPMQFAGKDNVVKSVGNLIKKLQKNHTLMLQFTMAAEESLYGDRARIWIDEIYIPFLEALDKTKKIPDVRKIRYRRQMRLLKNTQPGNPAPEFAFTSPDGREQKYFPMSTPTIIEFGDPTCEDCRMTRLKMESNASLINAVNSGRVNVLFIIPSADDSWAEHVIGYPANWTTGASDSVDDIYDIRLSPTLYVIDGNGKIIAKNIDVATAINLAIDSAGKINSNNSVK